MGWFGSLDLAWKLTTVFACLLVATLAAGFIKLAIDRRKMNQLLAKKAADLEQNNDQHGLSEKVKEEGDLFGIRALEAGFYGGIAQSRPGTPLVSAANTPKLISPATSVLDLSESQPSSSSNSIKNPSSSSRCLTPKMTLDPSDAERIGRVNHNTVNMSLTVPPSPKPSAQSGNEGASPAMSQATKTPVFAHKGTESPEILEPKAYVPYSPPRIPVMDAISHTSWRPAGINGEGINTTSVVVSKNYTPDATPINSEPSSPIMPFPAKLSEASILRRSKMQPCPTLPTERVFKDEGDSQPIDTVRSESYDMPAVDHNDYALKHQNYRHAQTCDISKTESLYSTDSQRISTVFRQSSVSSFSLSLDSSFDSFDSEISPAASPISRRLTFGDSLDGVPDFGNDPILSDFYDAYYRNSIGPVQNLEMAYVPDKLHVPRHSTIFEVPTPLASPLMSPDPQHDPSGSRFTGVGLAR
ncbi:uncharacterized protein K452DRAFT_316889 [Aplosporella prunicola CBS 121167]|uniref:Uncharacterized protein n=1 Tax=Aplosporella prunicola CBS 121167 TaxID=1176127 RepID=A0A6A6BL90_9PEZI|nr:uncharacterized protein K452DRAFT_316889 [Aplosporella prunicola CBS 121167]KAF2144153.1 hypothetical protein K452DRAFT_316889 [Aplosporella prunicola CBS 121167]